MSIYLDAIVPRLVEEEHSDAVVAFLAATRGELLISDFAAAEVASSLSRLVRIGQLSDSDAVASLGDFDIWRGARSAVAELHAADARLAYAYVRRFDRRLRAPDALHLAIAHRLRATLVTLDRRLSRAAASLGIMAQMPQ